MKLCYLPLNQAWVVCFGTNIVPISDQFIWNRREDLIQALNSVGLIVRPSGVVEKKQEEKNGDSN
jgi:hypothetical protein